MRIRDVMLMVLGGRFIQAIVQAVVDHVVPKSCNLRSKSHGKKMKIAENQGIYDQGISGYLYLGGMAVLNFMNKAQVQGENKIRG